MSIQEKLQTNNQEPSTETIIDNPKGFYELEGKFCDSMNIISVLSDLLTVSDSGRDLREDTMVNIGFVCEKAVSAGLEIFNKSMEYNLAYELKTLQMELQTDLNKEELDTFRSIKTAPGTGSEPNFYRAGVIKGRKECFETILNIIKVNDIVGEDSVNNVGIGKGLVIASNAIFEMINTPTPE